ncbi:putative CBL-interacting protein kinase 23 [Blattamonas nauphoetae]|uniref:CBL-interacting protein kinase 23 n=1 Tax=Blattamonas nauphoetae TaxID=2049346 RepID=A0ABQ9XA26_9EUKA|nr:putative CBL-interacting protein kinase 23 [Blattamonas nauphoetae]
MPPKPKPKQQSGFPITLPAPYVIVRSIGGGSFGSVYEAENTESKEHFAVKVLPCISDDQLSKNESEISKLKKNQHKHVVRLIKVIPDNGMRFMVMELCEYSLFDKMKIARGTQTKMDPVDVYDVMNGVLEGLSFLHNRNLAFGDMKPSNILIGKDGTAKLGDFGGVTQTDVQRTSDPKELGSMKFWPPEFFSLNKIEPSIASDMWGFGMILLELMTGRELISGEQSVLLSEAIRSFNLQNAITGFTENQQFLFRSLLAPNPQNRMTSSELLRSERLLHILENDDEWNDSSINAIIADLSARLTQLEIRYPTWSDEEKPFQRDDVVEQLRQAFPTFEYPKSYLSQLVEKYHELEAPNVFKASYLFLKREANEYGQSSGRGTPYSVFEQYHRSNLPDNKYIQLAMRQLAIDFPALPIPLINKTFIKHCRLYIPTGFYINARLDLDANPPTFVGQPFTPANRQDGNDDLSGQDPHFDADNSILDGDRLDDFCDMFDELHHPSFRLPPLPTELKMREYAKPSTHVERLLQPQDFPIDTVQSGICPTCYFPLSAVWKESHHFECRTCKIRFHVDWTWKIEKKVDHKGPVQHVPEAV